MKVQSLTLRNDLRPNYSGRPFSFDLESWSGHDYERFLLTVWILVSRSIIVASGKRVAITHQTAPSGPSSQRWPNSSGRCKHHIRYLERSEYSYISAVCQLPRAHHRTNRLSFVSTGRCDAFEWLPSRRCYSQGCKAWVSCGPTDDLGYGGSHQWRLLSSQPVSVSYSIRE